MAFYEDRARHVDLMIFDNFSTLGEVEDENSASEFNAVTEFLLRLKARGVATMLVHHANKAGDNFRGSSKLAATFETIVKLEKPEGSADAGDIDDARFRVAWQKVRAGGRQLRPVMARLVTSTPFGDEAPAHSTQLHGPPERSLWAADGSSLRGSCRCMTRCARACRRASSSPRLRSRRSEA